MKHLLTLVTFLALVGGALALQSGGELKAKVKLGAQVATPDATIIANELPSYPLTTCPVSGEALGSMGDPVNVVHAGHLVRVCCDGCVDGVAKMGDKIRAQVEAAVIAAQKPSYPLTTCPVAGVELDPAKAKDVVVGTRLVRTCCAKCAAKVTADPKAFLPKVDAALIAAQLETYPLTKCVVSAEPLDAMGGPVNKLYGVTLVRFCCDGCVKGFDRAPDKYLPVLTKALAAAVTTGKPANAGAVKKKQ